MTIEEIKEWWNTAITHDKHAMIDAIYALLEEVERLEKHNASSDQAVGELDQKLTIAIEALKKITEYKDQGNERECLYLTHTALERIKE